MGYYNLEATYKLCFLMHDGMSSLCDYVFMMERTIHFEHFWRRALLGLDRSTTGMRTGCTMRRYPAKRGHGIDGREGLQDSICDFVRISLGRGTRCRVGDFVTRALPVLERPSFFFFSGFKSSQRLASVDRIEDFRLAHAIIAVQSQGKQRPISTIK